MVISVPTVCPRASAADKATTTARSAAARMFTPRPLLPLDVIPVAGMGSRTHDSCIKPHILQSAAGQALLLLCVRVANLARSVAALTLFLRTSRAPRNLKRRQKATQYFGSQACVLCCSQCVAALKHTLSSLSTHLRTAYQHQPTCNYTQN